MNNDDIIERLSDKAGIRKKVSGKVVSIITSSIESDLLQGIQVTLSEIGKLKRIRVKTSVHENPDGSCKVMPPFEYAEFLAYKETDQLNALHTAQRIISRLASEAVEAYKDAEVAYKQFCKIIRKNLNKGRRVKLSGLGAFSTLTEGEDQNESSIKFEISQKLQKRLNENFEDLKEKVIFPIPPVLLIESRKQQEVKGQLSNEPVSDDNNFLQRKLAMISQDLIRLNEEINNKAKKKDGGGLWG